jgi:hypothetical protein
MVFRYKSNMDRLGIRLSLFQPEKGSFAVTKTLQIGMSDMASQVASGPWYKKRLNAQNH